MNYGGEELRDADKVDTITAYLQREQHDWQYLSFAIEKFG